MTSAGKRNKRIAIYDMVTTLDAYGNRSKGLQLAGIKWAELKQSSPGREQETAKTFSPTTSVSFLVLYDATINHTQVIQLEGTYYSIDSVSGDNFRRETMIYSTELTDLTLSIRSLSTPASLPFSLPHILGFAA